MRFELKIYRDADGVSLLELEAVDLLAARRDAETKGYTVLSAKSASKLSSRISFFQGRGFSVALFAQELLALLDAGMNLVESIAILARKAKHPESKHVLDELHRLVGEGRTFSRALEGIPNAFPALFVATVRTSERTGNLAEALRRYLAYQRQINGVRDKMVSAAVYPVLLMLV